MGTVALPVETITTRTFSVEAARLRAVDVGGNTGMTDGMSTPNSEAQSSTSYAPSSDGSSDKPFFSDDGEVLDIDSPSVSSDSSDEEEGPEEGSEYSNGDRGSPGGDTDISDGEPVSSSVAQSCASYNSSTSSDSSDEDQDGNSDSGHPGVNSTRTPHTRLRCWTIATNSRRSASIIVM